MKKRTSVISQRRPGSAVKSIAFRRTPLLNPLHWVVLLVASFTVILLTAGITSAHTATTSTTSTTSSLWAQKQRVLQQQHDAGMAHRGSKTGPAAHGPAVQPAPTRQAGISNVGQGPFSPAVFTMRNSWQGPVGNDWVFAYAGAKPNADHTSELGSIVLYTQTANADGGFDFHPLGTFAAPAGTTALTIISVKGTLLQLRSDTGQTLTFNMATRQFS